ncbi:DUF2919 domain-containing protein [Colwellia sp. D2M02]|uniref:DUF2919 family protein n=1 Tax=Colwellia sp. D2M02 TaxID=2841562 RepID=UPI001C095220|nr:DUF2919 domain-containing protein [Colwellia sp. D2M02]
MTNAYKHYSIEDFDHFDCLKLSKLFYLVLLFVLRGYIIWLISVTNMRDRVGLMEWIYPQTDLFILSLVSGALGLFVVLIISLRRPDAAPWVQKCWPYCRAFLLIALLFDLFVNVAAVLYLQLLPIAWLIGQAIIVIALIALCFASERMKINLVEFPQKLPEK